MQRECSSEFKLESSMTILSIANAQHGNSDIEAEENNEVEDALN